LAGNGGVPAAGFGAAAAGVPQAQVDCAATGAGGGVVVTTGASGVTVGLFIFNIMFNDRSM
jgi:hypothetical protein